MVGLGNLFRRLDLTDGDLTAVLLALLEHADPALLAGLLDLGDLPGPPLTEPSLLYPAPEGPAGWGEIRTAHRRVRLAALGPGARPPTLADAEVEALVISPSGEAPPPAHGLSWEQVDRWLASLEERYDPEGRTGYLLRQFRAFLPAVGITYFAGFDLARLAALPAAHAQVNGFWPEAAAFFQQLGPELAARCGGVAEIRQARAEDLLAGYCYRDYAGPGLGEVQFLRVALQIAQGQLQVTCWIGPPGAAQQRLRQGLLAPVGLGPLLELGGAPLLWLWSPEGERHLPLAGLAPTQVESVDWSAYQAGVQVNHPATFLAGEGVVGRVAAAAGDLLKALAPVLAGVVH